VQNGATANPVTIVGGMPANVASSAQGVLSFNVTPAGAVVDSDVIFADGLGP
jgi:hypothetical protein